MLLRWLLAAAHLLALGIGLGSVWVRARLLGSTAPDAASVRRALSADVWWAVAAALWFASGLEVRPIIVLGAWRREIGAGRSPDLRAAAGIARTSYVQVALMILMVLAATAIARGLG